MRSGWVKTSKPSARAMPISVMPASSASRDRKRGRCGDGDHDRRAEHRRLLHHLDRDAAGQQQQAVGPPITPSRASAPASLSSALCRPTSSRNATSPRCGCQKPAACTAWVCWFSFCAAGSAAIAAWIAGGIEACDRLRCAAAAPDGIGAGFPARTGRSRSVRPGGAGAASWPPAALGHEPHAQLDALLGRERSPAPRCRRRVRPCPRSG